MKRLFKRILTVTVIGSVQQLGFGQASNWNPILNNNYNPIGYLGWNGTSGANPLLTRTNNINRMLISGGTAGNTQGRVALGNNLPNSFLPANRLHLHQDNGNFGIQFTNNNTGITAANGFEMNLYNNSIFQFHQHQMANVNFRMPSSLLMQLTWNNGPSNAGIC